MYVYKLINFQSALCVLCLLAMGMQFLIACHCLGHVPVDTRHAPTHFDYDVTRRVRPPANQIPCLLTTQVSSARLIKGQVGRPLLLHFMALKPTLPSLGGGILYLTALAPLSK